MPKRVPNDSGGAGPLANDHRNGWQTLLLLDGEHPKVVADLLGDASVETVLDTYSHVLPVLHERAALRMETRLFGNSAN